MDKYPVFSPYFHLLNHYNKALKKINVKDIKLYHIKF